ncbi:MAG: transposase [Oscillospiraceae bacterium]|nr:transposase [Oscillospiraceae bacterium]
MSDNQLERFPIRKSPRLKYFDYSKPHWYFVTICTSKKRCIFGAPEALSAHGIIAKDAFLEIPKHFPNVAVEKYVVMPNHVHAMIAVNHAGTELPLVVGHYKAYVTKQIHLIEPALTVWQTSFHDHVIRNQADYLRIWKYIDTNPIKWTEDCFFCDP